MSTQPAPHRDDEQITALSDTLYDALYAITPYAEPHFADQTEGLKNAVRAVLAEVQLHLGMAGLHARITELEASHASTIADRDEQIITWLLKKAGEYGTSNRESRAKNEAVRRMADKLSRGAVREPLPAPDIEYGIRLAPDAPEAETLTYPGYHRSRVEERLARHRTGNPEARLMQRTLRVRHGQWTEATTEAPRG